MHHTGTNTDGTKYSLTETPDGKFQTIIEKDGNRKEQIHDNQVAAMRHLIDSKAITLNLPEASDDSES